MIELQDHVRHALATIENSSDPKEKRDALIPIVRELPKAPEFLPLFHLTLDAINKIENPVYRRAALSEIVKELPKTDNFSILYLRGVESLIDTAGYIEEPIYRKSELLRIANELPGTEGFIKLRLQAMRIALDLSDNPFHKKASIQAIAKELPKSSDVSFYRRYTLVGIASALPKSGEFANLYKEAIHLAIKAAEVIEEPYYREYALLYIARGLLKADEYLAMYKLVMADALKAAVAIKDPPAKKYALLDIIKELPKTKEFSELLQQVIEEALKFCSVKSRLENVDILGKIDYFIAGENRRITEAKKASYAKVKYIQALAREIEEVGSKLNDIRLIKTLQPYTHIWTRPAELRLSAKKVVDQLERLMATYHGREIESPFFIDEYHLPHKKISGLREKDKTIPKNSLVIDLGATNTVIMKKKEDNLPEFISLGPVSKVYGETCVVPTVLNPGTNSIGAEALGKDSIVNIKKMLLDGSPRAKEYMERYVRILYQHLKKALPGKGGFSLFANTPLADMLYVTVPVGFHDYRKDLKDILERTIKGVNIELVEEPLAAAIGYQVADDRDKIVMLIDFGGCTLNTMMLRLNKNEAHVIAKPDRAKMLGGRDIDQWLASYLANKAGIPEEDIPYKLILGAEDIKIALSRQRLATCEWEGSEVCKISREDFEEILARHDFYKTIDRTISNILKRAEKIGIKKDMLEAVLLTGGSSQIPSFKEKISHLFPQLAEQNAIYDHSPLSAAAQGAALHGTRDIVTDRHLSMAYAIRYTTKNSDTPYAYKLILEKGESLPMEKTFKITPAMTLGIQNEILVELFEIPENMITRKWVGESGIEFIKQEIKHAKDLALKGLKIITLAFKEPVTGAIPMILCVDEKGYLTVRYGIENTETETGIRLQ